MSDSARNFAHDADSEIARLREKVETLMTDRVTPAVTQLASQAEDAANAYIRAIAPVHHICGNHDREFLSVAQNEAILGQSLQSETLDMSGWRIVLWRADTRIRRPGGFQCAESDIAWLSNVIDAADRPLLIASHVPLSGHSQIGNYYFQRNPASSTYPDHGERIREVLRTSKVPSVCLAGHVHWNTITTVDGIPHLTQQSLTESFVMSPENGAGEPCGAHGLLELSSDSIDWRVFGADAFHAIVPVAQTGRRWYRPLGDFSVLPGHTEREARIAAFHAQAQAAE